MPASLLPPALSPPLLPREAHPLHSTALLGQGDSQQPESASSRLSLSLWALLRVPWTRRDALMWKEMVSLGGPSPLQMRRERKKIGSENGLQ